MAPQRIVMNTMFVEANGKDADIVVSRRHRSLSQTASRFPTPRQPAHSLG